MKATVLQRLNTPAKVQRWLASLKYNTADTMRTLPTVNKLKTAHCLEGAMAAAALLEPHGYPPLILDLESEDLLDHTLFIFQRGGKWGAVGKSRDIGLDGRKPVFKTVEALARSYIIPYIDAKAHIKRYGVLDLSGIAGPGSAGRTRQNISWRSSKRNVWYVEGALRAMPHQTLATPRRVVEYWRKRYVQFRQHHPNRQPDYFPQQQSWM
jgi:hypothetical protein